jgi:hypothetical protein
MKEAFQLMTEEVEKSFIAVQTLGILSLDSFIDSQTQQLQKTNREYVDYSETLGQAGSLVQKMKQQEWRDRMCIYLALFVFVLSCTFVMIRRFSSPWLWLGSKLISNQEL